MIIVIDSYIGEEIMHFYSVISNFGFLVREIHRIDFLII